MIVVKSAKLGSLVRYVGWPLASLFAYDVVIASAYVFLGWTWLAVPDVPLSIFGGVIGVLAGFRNTSAYARWWEARIIWGAIVNSSRSFAREVLSMIAAPESTERDQRQLCEVKRTLVLLQIAYVHALRHHLRGQSPREELAALLPESELASLTDQKHVPIAVQQRMAALIADCHQRGWIDSIRWASLDRTLSNLMDSQGASERIKNTPMPRQYDMFIRRFINIYCLVLPLGMVQSLGLMTPIGSTFVGFIFLALDQIGRDLETPFENLPHDVALTSISRTIEINLKQMIGERELPEPLAPVDGVLW
jgi:ion channel-forming bestrophin family protein